MNAAKIRLAVAGALLFLTGVGTGLYAQSATDSHQRVEHQRADLSGAPGMEVIVSTAEYRPGESIDAHIHHGIEASYVIQGAHVQTAGKTPVSIPTGTSMLMPRDVKHAGFTIVGDASLKLFTVHVVDKGKPLYDFSH